MKYICFEHIYVLYISTQNLYFLTKYVHKKCKILTEQKSLCHFCLLPKTSWVSKYVGCVLLEWLSSSTDVTEYYKLSIWDPSGQCSKTNKRKTGLARPEYTGLGSSTRRDTRESIRGRRSHRQMRATWQTDGHDRKRDGQRDILLRRRRPQSRGSDEGVPARPSSEVRSRAVKLI